MTGKMTRAGVEKLERELADLVGVRRAEAIGLIVDSRGSGDSSDDGDYKSALEIQGQVEGRIRELEVLLARVEVVDVPVSPEQVSVGTWVTVDFGDGAPETYRYVSAAEVHGAEQCLSPDSPLGQALDGARPGDVVTTTTPGGVLRVKVLSVHAEQDV